MPKQTPNQDSLNSGDPYFVELSAARRSKGVWGMVLGLALTAVTLTAVLLPAPYVIERPGTAYNVLGNTDSVETISISGAKVYPTDGALELMTIELYGNRNSTPTWMELLFAWLDPAQQLIPLDLAFPPEVDDKKVTEDNQLMFVGSEVYAEAAALRSLGYQLNPVLQVQAIKNGMPADKLLQIGDEPVSVDGLKITDVEQFVTAVKNSSGKSLAVEVSRAGKLVTVNITPKKVDGDYKIGIVIGDGFDFPITAKVNIADVGGPSGGLMLALGIYDKLTPGSLTGANIIAGTGTIDPDGKVGPIGGIISKMYLARSTGAQYFLTPSANCADAKNHVPKSLTLLKVDSLSDGIRAVESIAKGTAKDWPTCSVN